MANLSLNGIREFRMDQVVNLDSYAVNALEKDISYLISFDVDKLLAGFRETAGLSTRGATRYSGWESTLIGGHSVGHYLSAVAQAYVNRGVNEETKARIKEILSALLNGLKECQDHTLGKKGFIFGSTILDINNVEIQFDNIEKNLTNINTEAWVPWYTMHKILAGLVDVYKLTGINTALDIAINLGDWVYDRVSSWDLELALSVIKIEYGGMNDVLYDLYSLTGTDKYAIAAHVFDSIELFERVSSGVTDALNNHHANTTIPKFMGALNRYYCCNGRVINGETIDARKYLEYAIKFWDMVVNKHTYVTGGNSEWEHFGKDNILDKERTNCNCETCNIYNMLKFSRKLFAVTGDTKYLNFYENAYYNTILSSQNPETGMTTYFQPMSTGYFKVFGERFNKFWCCTGTGMENFTKLNDSIYFHNDDTIFINLYEDSNVNWEEHSISLSMSANLQMSDKVLISVSGVLDDHKLALRIPDWVDGKPHISINGISESLNIEEGFIVVNCSGVSLEIELTLPMKVNSYSLADNDRSIAFKYGPTVLSSNLGTSNMGTTTTGVMVTIPSTKVRGFDEIILPSSVSPEEFINNPEKFLIKTDSPSLEFELGFAGLKFAPHFKRYKERYGIYHCYYSAKEMEEIKAQKLSSLGSDFEGEIIDTVQPGYGQYENDELHRLTDWGGSVGSTDNGTSRYAKPGGFFTYYMCVSEMDINYLSLTFLKEDTGKSIKVSSGDVVFYEEVLDFSGIEESYEVRIKIPTEVIAKAETVVANNETHRVIPITFRGSEGSESARLFGFVHVMAKK